MALYVEVMCDIRSPRSPPDRPWELGCWSDKGENPQGHSVRIARDEARDQGWTLGRGRMAICPFCATPTPSQAKAREEEL